MMAGYVAKLAAHLVLWGIMYASNKSRDRKLGPADEKLAAAAGMEDKTESVKQNPYVLSLSRTHTARDVLTRACALQELPLRPLRKGGRPFLLVDLHGRPLFPSPGPVIHHITYNVVSQRFVELDLILYTRSVFRSTAGDFASSSDSEMGVLREGQGAGLAGVHSQHMSEKQACDGQQRASMPTHGRWQ